MQTGQTAKKYAATDEERQLLIRVLDLASRAADTGSCRFSVFLSPAERALLLRVPELSAVVTLSFAGGYADAERTVAVLCPRGAKTPDAPIAVLAIDYKGNALSHRDILGALMALGIKREKLGDILTLPGRALVVCDETMAPYICEQLERAGRNRVRAHIAALGDIPPPRFESKQFSVQSLRLDSIVAGGFGLSRPDAADAVRKGQVYVNWRQTDAPGKEVAEGDRVSLRGRGKLRLARIGGQSRKGRTFIEVDVYL